MNISEAVKRYNELRDQIKEIETRHKEELAPLKQKKEQVETVFLQFLNEQGGEHFATENGTIYRRTSNRASVKDWAATLDWIIANEDWDVLERRVSAEAIHERLEEGTVIPGVDFHQYVTATVRRK